MSQSTAAWLIQQGAVGVLALVGWTVVIVLAKRYETSLKEKEALHVEQKAELRSNAITLLALAGKVQEALILLSAHDKAPRR